MTREEFKRLDIMEQITFINNELIIHKSITKVCDVHNFRKQTVIQRFQKVGYSFDKNTNQYTKVNESKLEAEEPIEEPSRKTSKVVKESNNTNIKDNKIKALEDEIKGLKKDINKIYKLLGNNEYTKVNNSKLEEIINNDLNNLDNKELVTRTYKLYSSVDVELEEYIRKNKQYKKQDIINSIFKDYLNKNK